MTKVAFPTDDGETISQHLGQALFFQVVMIEDGKVQSSERRENPAITMPVMIMMQVSIRARRC